MAVFSRADLGRLSFIIIGDRDMVVSNAAILAQDAGRSGDIAQFTLFAMVGASGLYVPFTDETAVDGSQFPVAIYLGNAILEADIVAGDVANLSIVKLNAHFDVDQLVIESAKTLDTVVVSDKRTVRQHLLTLGLVPGTVEFISNPENPEV